MTSSCCARAITVSTCKSREVIDWQLRGHSIPFLGTNSQVYCNLLLSTSLRHKPSAKSDFCRVSLDAFGRYGGPKPAPQKTPTYLFYSYHMKPSGNESLHRPDHEMVYDRNFFDCLTPDRSPQSSSDDVTKVC